MKENSRIEEYKNIDEKEDKKSNFYRLLIITFMIGVILLVATYAWFYTALDVRIHTFTMKVSNENGLYISLDGINFDSTVEVSEDILINKLKSTYPNNTSKWTYRGLMPVSTSGLSNQNNAYFDMYESISLGYIDKKKEAKYLSTKLIEENNEISSGSKFIAFDLFFKNVTGSPISDNLYLDDGTSIELKDKYSEDADGLYNSLRLGFIKIGSTSLKSSTDTIQNISCNGNCKSIIYEPNSTSHSELSSLRVKEYGINLRDGQYYDTYASVAPCEQLNIKNAVSGSIELDTSIFKLQETITNFSNPLFEIPDGITKARVYLWIEGQDIDNLESDSKGANLNVKINFVKDTRSYDYFN